MKHFLIEITYTVPAEELGETVAEHRSFLQEGYDRRWLLLSGPQSPRMGVIIVARAPSLEELQGYFGQDPFKRKKLAIYRFTEFEPVKRQNFLEGWVTGGD